MKLWGSQPYGTGSFLGGGKGRVTSGSLKLPRPMSGKVTPPGLPSPAGHGVACCNAWLMHKPSLTDPQYDLSLYIGANERK